MRSLGDSKLNLDRRDHASSATMSSFDNKYARALVVCSLSQLHDPHFLAPIIQTASRATRNHIVILLFSSHFDTHRGWYEVQKLLTWVYVQSTAITQEMGKVLIEVDVLLRGTNGSYPPGEFDIVYRVEDGMFRF